MCHLAPNDEYVVNIGVSAYLVVGGGASVSINVNELLRQIKYVLKEKWGIL